jgi:rhamnosyltransferase
MGAVITAFRPDDRLEAACRSVADQVGLVVVVDDGSPPGHEDVLRRCADLGAVVVRHGANRGVGAALDTGLDELRARLGDGLSHVLTLDQDSRTPPGYVDALLTAEAAARAAGLRPGLVGPARAGAVRAAGVGAGEGYVISREPIQSGLLIARAALDEVGDFDAALFIDGVDTDYYLRTRSAGLAVVAAPGTRLEHALGSEHEVLGAGRGPRVVHAAAFRYYYIARNRVHLVRRHGRRHPGWAVSAVARDVRHLLLVTLLVPGRRVRLARSWTGLVDGLRGVLGPDPRHVS